MPTINLDQVAGYGLVRQPPTVRLDQVGAFALVGTSKALTYTTEVKQHVANSINATHNLNLKVADFDLGAPSNAQNGKYNASVRATMKPSSGYSGNIDLAYQRQNISDLILGRNMDLFKRTEGALLTTDYVAKFNSLFGTKITTADIVSESVPTSATCFFTAADTSIWFIPGTKVDMGILYAGARDWEIAGLTWPTQANFASFFKADTLVAALGTLLGRTLDPTKCTVAATAAANTDVSSIRDSVIQITYPSVDGTSNITSSVYYYRLALSGLSAYTFATTPVWVETGTTLYSILSYINAVTGLALTTASVEDYTFPTLADDATTVVVPLVAKATSRFFKGSYNLTVNRMPHIKTLFATTGENLGSI